MKLFKQLACIILVASIFVGMDLFVYNYLTKMYINHSSVEMQAKSVEVSKYLPFDEESGIVRYDSELKLEGDIPIIDGAAALVPVYSAFVNSIYPEESVSFDGEDFTTDSKMQYHNTRGAFTAVVDGDVDIIICAGPSSEQLEYAKSKGVELELIPLGYEAFVFLVNQDNPVDDLSVEQVKGIYSGKYTNWSEVGGDNRPIEALQRNSGSGSQTALLMFMGDTPVVKKYTGINPRTIGFSFRYYVESVVQNGSIKMLSLNGIYPSKENVANGTYPMYSYFYAIYVKDNDNPNIQVMIDWMLSDEGQKIIDESGYVPL